MPRRTRGQESTDRGYLPPVFLKAGDTVSVTVEGIGTLTNPVVGP